MPNRQCCICAGPLKGIGCRADPFSGGMCCDDCKDRFVDPVRVICGDAVVANGQLLKVLRAIAKEGRHIREQRAISQAMAALAEPVTISWRDDPDQLADEDDPPEQAIREG